MFDVGSSLRGALENAANALSGAASATARAVTPLGSERPDAAMATAAERALFNEALLNAMHARFAEIHGVTHQS